MNLHLGAIVYAIYLPAMALVTYRVLLFFVNEIIRPKVAIPRRLLALLAALISLGICSFVTLWTVYKFILVGLLASILYQITAPKLKETEESPGVRALLLTTSVLGSYMVLEIFFDLWNLLVVRPL